jgi:hypothetical protein
MCFDGSGKKRNNYDIEKLLREEGNIIFCCFHTLIHNQTNQPTPEIIAIIRVFFFNEQPNFVLTRKIKSAPNCIDDHDEEKARIERDLCKISHIVEYESTLLISFDFLGYILTKNLSRILNKKQIYQR